MKKYSLYLFDFDYTLADSGKAIVFCFRHVLDMHGYKNISDEAIKRTIGKTLEESFSILTGVTDDNILQQYKRDYVKKADVCMTEMTYLFPETVDVLKTLKDRGVKIGIISTKYRYRITSIFDYLGVSDSLVDIIIGGEDVEKAKPSPEGVLKAICHFNLDKNDVLYLGDSTVDAETAEAAGVDFAAILHGTTTRQELSSYPHVAICDDLWGCVNL